MHCLMTDGPGPYVVEYVQYVSAPHYMVSLVKQNKGKWVKFQVMQATGRTCPEFLIHPIGVSVIH